MQRGDAPAVGYIGTGAGLEQEPRALLAIGLDGVMEGGESGALEVGLDPRIAEQHLERLGVAGLGGEMDGGALELVVEEVRLGAYLQQERDELGQVIAGRHVEEGLVGRVADELVDVDAGRLSAQGAAHQALEGGQVPLLQEVQQRLVRARALLLQQLHLQRVLVRVHSYGL